MSSSDPQAATTTAVESHPPRRHDGFLNRGIQFPSASESWKRATRVTASTAERMNSASNMIAKWYQNPAMDEPPIHWRMMFAMPTASVGAPPVREITDSSPTSSATASSASTPV